MPVEARCPYTGRALRGADSSPEIACRAILSPGAGGWQPRVRAFAFQGEIVATFSVTNLEKYQHYKDRSPPWIKLYIKILNDYAVDQLPDAGKWHFCAIMLLASREENILPYDPAYIARQIGATAKVDLDVMIELGLLSYSETETETETEGASAMLADTTRKQDASKNKRKGRKDVEAWFNEYFWKEYPRHEGKVKARGKLLQLMPDAELQIKIMAGLRKYKQTAQWLEDTKFIPHATTWINAKRWEDDLVIESNGGPKSAIARAAAGYEKQNEGGQGADGDVNVETETDLPY